MAKYRKIPVIIDAWVYNHTLDVSKFEGVNHCVGEHGHVMTLEGEVTIHTGDYLVRGTKGEFYPVRKDIFEETFEEVENMREKV